MRIALLGLPLVLALASCEVRNSDQTPQHQQGQKEQQSAVTQSRSTSPAPDPLAARDPRIGQPAAVRRSPIPRHGR